MKNKEINTGLGPLHNSNWVWGIVSEVIYIYIFYNESQGVFPVCHLIYWNRDVKVMVEELKMMLKMRTQYELQLIIVIEMSQVST